MQHDMRTLVQRGYEHGQYAALFRAHPDPTPFEQTFLDAFCRVLPHGGHILDLGSGTGVPYDRYLVQRGYQLTGIDFSATHVAQARAQVPEATYQLADFSTVVFPAEHVDGMLSLYALFHLPRHEHHALLAKFSQWLRPHGMLLITVGASDMEWVEEREWAGAPMVWSSYAPERYEHLLHDLGYTIEQSAYEGAPGAEEHHFWILARKGGG